MRHIEFIEHFWQLRGQGTQIGMVFETVKPSEQVRQTFGFKQA
jgi:hypothetical protein